MDSVAITWPHRVAAAIVENGAYTTQEQMLEAVYATVDPELWDWVSLHIHAAWRNAYTEAEDHFVRILCLPKLYERRMALAALPPILQRIVKERLNEHWKRKP